MKFKLFATAMLVSTVATGQTEKYQCKTACDPNKLTPYCLVAPQNPKITPALRSLRAKFAASTTPLSAPDLRTWFGLASDPCGRSDTTFTGGVWSNTGAACLLGTQLDLVPGGKPVEISLSVPSKLQFTVVNTGGVSKYSVLNSMPYLLINDANLQMDWGGIVKEITATDTSALFQIQRGCIKIQF